MREKGPSLLIALLALTAVLQGSAFKPAQGPSASSLTQGAAAGSKDVSGASANPSSNAKPQWQRAIRLYQDFFGIPGPPAQSEVLTLDLQTVGPVGDRKEHLAFEGHRESGANATDSSAIDLIVKQAHDAHYEMEFRIVLVPDPLDSDVAANSDYALAAIQSGFAESGYLLDRFWLPWKDEATVRDRAFRTTPGLLLFRHPIDTTHPQRQLAGVFLVGESPKLGIHKAAFANTLELIVGFLDALHLERTVRIVGPSFSGSAESLRLALSKWREDGRPPVKLQVVTGTATAPRLENYFSDPHLGITFCRTVVSDDVLFKKALSFLDELGWKDQPVALLTESDTAYGGGKPLDSRQVQVPFPSGLASLRTATESNGSAQGQDSGKAVVQLRQLALGLSLAESEQPADIVPEWSPLTPRAKQLAISNLLSAVSRDGIRRIGIRATDVRDRIFLAKLSRELFPDVVLFSFNNDLLYAHPQYGADLDGMLVLSSFPLLTEGPRWRPLLGGPVYPFRRQFASTFEEGIFRAVQYSLDRTGEPYPRVWIAAVGNGSLWPIASRPVEEQEPTRFCPRSGNQAALPEPGGDESSSSLTSRIDLPLVSFVLLLSLFAFGLGRVAPPMGLRDEHGRVDRTTQCLLALGWAVLWLLGATLIVIGTLPFRSAIQWQLMAAALLGSLYTALLGGAAAWSRAEPPLFWREALKLLSWRKAGIALLLGGLGTLLLGLALHWLWMPGDGADYFHLRARRFSSGLSPLVALALWSAGIYAWLLLELKRRRLIVRQALPWPLTGLCDPPLADCAHLAEPLEALVRQSLPDCKSRFWWFFGLAVVPPAIFLVDTVQPIAETKLYGWIFVLRVFSGLGLAAISFYQFIRLWRTLRRILDRLCHTSRLMKAFRRVSPKVDWKPMRSFGWQMPIFATVTLSVNKLRRFLPESRQESVEGLLGKIFSAEQEGSLTREIQARRELDCIFSSLCQELAKAKAPEIDDLFAVRVVAYLRPLFGHMRNALLASMASGLFTLAAVRTYAFQPQQFLSFGLWGALLVGVGVTLWTFVEMDRNATLSAIGGTKAGQVTFDGHFVLNILTYGVIPVLGVLISQFPQISRLFVEWFNPLLRATG